MNGLEAAVVPGAFYPTSADLRLAPATSQLTTSSTGTRTETAVATKQAKRGPADTLPGASEHVADDAPASAIATVPVSTSADQVTAAAATSSSSTVPVIAPSYFHDPVKHIWKSTQDACAQCKNKGKECVVDFHHSHPGYCLSCWERPNRKRCLPAFSPEIRAKEPISLRHFESKPWMRMRKSMKAKKPKATQPAQAAPPTKRYTRASARELNPENTNPSTASATLPSSSSSVTVVQETVRRALPLPTQSPPAYVANESGANATDSATGTTAGQTTSLGKDVPVTPGQQHADGHQGATTTSVAPAPQVAGTRRVKDPIQFAKRARDRLSVLEELTSKCDDESRNYMLFIKRTMERDLAKLDDTDNYIGHTKDNIQQVKKIATKLHFDDLKQWALWFEGILDDFVVVNGF